MRTKIKLQGMNFDIMYYYDKECRKCRVTLKKTRNWVSIILSRRSNYVYVSAKAEAPHCGVRIPLRDKSDLIIIRLPLPYK